MQLTEVSVHPELKLRLKTPTCGLEISIGGHLYGTLGEHQGGSNDLGLGAVTIDGRLLRRSNFTGRVSDPAAAEIGVPELRFHGVRYTHAPIRLAAGGMIPQVSRRLRHANAATTLGIYVHALPGTERSAADAMDRLFSIVPVLVAEASHRTSNRSPALGEVVEIGETPGPAAEKGA